MWTTLHRYAEEILAKQSVFWELDSSQLKGITNALIQSPNNLAAQGLPFEEVRPRRHLQL
jgi:hypothetical protein